MGDSSHRIFSHRILKYGSIMFIATSIVNVSNYLFHVVMGRMLGPASYGILTSLLSIFLIISVPAGTVQTVITKYVSTFKARNQYGKISYLLFTSLEKLFFYGVLGFLIFSLISGYLASFLQIPSRIPVIILGTFILVSVILPVVYGGLWGLQSFGHLGSNMVMGAFLRLAFGILLVFISFGVNGAIAASALSTFIVLLLAFLPLKFLNAYRYDDPKINSSEMYQYFWPVLITLLCFTILTNIDVVLVKHFFTPVEAGHYSAAAIFGKIVLFLPGAVAMVMFPMASEFHALGKDPEVILQKSLLLVGAMCGTVALSYFLFPSFVVSLLFGKKYMVSVPLLGPFGIAMTLFALLNIMLYYHLSVHNLNFIYALVACTILQVILLWFLHDTLQQVIYILAANAGLLFVLNWLLVHRRQLAK